MSKDKKDKQKETPETTPETAQAVDEMEALKAELDSAKDKYFRALAEMDNFKKRATEESKRERKYRRRHAAQLLVRL